MEMTPERWSYTREYLSRTFGQQDDHLAGLMDDAKAAGLPDIAVSADVGWLLKLLTATTRGRLAIEVGTLAGYSGIWIARGLSDRGRLHTIEIEERNADFAAEQFKKAGVGDRVVLERGAGLEVLPKLAAELAPGSVDVAFIDAVKMEYPAYWRHLRPLIAVGGWFIADNVLGAGSWWIDSEDNASRNAVDELNRTLAADADFETTCVPLREGVLLARRVR